MKAFAVAGFVWVGLFLMGCGGVVPTRGDFAGGVEVGGNRTMYLECRGSGSPTVVLVSGTGGASDEWTHTIDAGKPDGAPVRSDDSVFEQVSAFTRVCAYDRPGTQRFDGTFGDATFVRQPTTAEDGVADLHALLEAADEHGPFVLVGASWGGMIVRLYAGAYPDEVAGLVFVDGASEFLKDVFTRAQWGDWMNKVKGMLATENVEVPDYESSVQEILNRPALPGIPAVVLTSDKEWDLQVGDSGSTWGGWLEAQERLAEQLGAKHISKTDSGHGIAVEQPQSVVGAIREVVEASRRVTPAPPN